MEINESEYTITLITNAKGFYTAATYFLEKYRNELCYETIICYNDKARNRIDNLKKKDTNELSQKTYRTIIRNKTPIPPNEFQRFVIPEQQIDKTQLFTTDTIFQKKTTLQRNSEIVPFILNNNNKAIIVQCTWKFSVEINMSEHEFRCLVLDNINYTDKSFVPSFGQTRACIYDVEQTGIRLSIGKGFSFGGIQEDRRPTNPYYYMEFEKEHKDEQYKSSSYAMR